MANEFVAASSIMDPSVTAAVYAITLAERTLGSELFGAAALGLATPSGLLRWDEVYEAISRGGGGCLDLLRGVTVAVARLRRLEVRVDAWRELLRFLLPHDAARADATELSHLVRAVCAPLYQRQERHALLATGLNRSAGLRGQIVRALINAVFDSEDAVARRDAFAELARRRATAILPEGQVWATLLLGSGDDEGALVLSFDVVYASPPAERGGVRGVLFSTGCFCHAP